MRHTSARQRRFFAVLFVALAIGLNSCAAIREVGRDQLEGGPESTALLILSYEVLANFQDRGLLSMGLGFSNKAYPSGGTIRDAYGKKVVGIANSHVVVFSGLLPGSYTLMSLRGTQSLDENAKKRIYDCPRANPGPSYVTPPPEKCVSYIEIELMIPPERQPEFTFEVASGEIVYGGKFAFDENHDPPFGGREERDFPPTTWDVHSHVLDSQAQYVVTREDHFEALKVVRGSFRSSPWTAILEEQLATMAPPTSER